MGKQGLYDEASKVAADDGEVTVDGPDGVAVSLTPEAAAETSDRLLHGAAEAAGQRRAKQTDEKKSYGKFGTPSDR